MKAELEVELTPVSHSRSRFADYLELTKPRIAGMVLVTTFAGFYMASSGPMNPWRILNVLLGTGLVGGGASALNQVFEREPDSRMRRTQNRPLPAGRMSFAEALAFACMISIIGVVYLALTTNFLTAGIAAVTLLSYAFIYTPLKRVSSLNTMIGAVPGALPPLIGWAAAANNLSMQSLSLFAILYFWQLPHFYAIAWLYREDYERGGFRMITHDDPQGENLGQRVLGHSLALVLASLTPTLWNLTGVAYFVCALVLGIAFMVFGYEMVRSRTRESARRVLLASVIYLPLLLAVMLLGKT